MGDMGDEFRAWGKLRQDKRAQNRGTSANALTAAGVAFVSKNDGAHLIVEGSWDFWPGTGLYRSRTLPTQGRGVNNLLRALGK